MYGWLFAHLGQGVATVRPLTLMALCRVLPKKATWHIDPGCAHWTSLVAESFEEREFILEEALYTKGRTAYRFKSG